MAFFPVFLLPLVGPGLALGLLLSTGWRRQRRSAGLALALGLLLPLFLLAQGLLSIASWCAQPLASAGPAPYSLPWYGELLLAPVCYVYFRVLTNNQLRTPGAWRYLLPGLSQVALFAGVAILA
jgi:glucose-6-phosphate-specific signal transduction histidine kinase